MHSEVFKGKMTKSLGFILKYSSLKKTDDDRKRNEQSDNLLTIIEAGWCTQRV